MNKKILLSLGGCLTIGLAPFAPEPHIWQKLKWIFSGAVGMQALDWFDVVLHGIPWALLIYFCIQFIANSKSAKTKL